jgi:hypothetical protein
MIDISFVLKSVFPDILGNGHMYLDPGSGSFLLQILIATIAGAGIFLATYWRKVRAFFDRTFGKKQEAQKAQKAKKSKDE